MVFEYSLHKFGNIFLVYGTAVLFPKTFADFGATITPLTLFDRRAHFFRTTKRTLGQRNNLVPIPISVTGNMRPEEILWILPKSKVFYPLLLKVQSLLSTDDQSATRIYSHRKGVRISKCQLIIADFN